MSSLTDFIRHQATRGEKEKEGMLLFKTYM
jgi:hypothetical protein